VNRPEMVGGHFVRPKRVTPDWVRACVEEIRRNVGDDEVAHSLEDALHRIVLISIAEAACSNMRLCSEEALKTLGFGFERWSA
jgi:hypothetical protein